jgi:hypothetical protein
MNIHIITPFHRENMIKTLIKYMEPMNIIWYPVCDPDEIQSFEGINEDWIRPVLCPPLIIPPDQAFRKLNDFLNAAEIIDKDYYAFMGDDDMFEPGFFDVIKQQTAKIIFCSLARGDTIPAEAEGAGRHPVYPLIINGPEDVRVFNIGLMQFIIKGEIARQVRFNNTSNHDDGKMAEFLKNTFPDDIVYLPGWFGFGNYFEPGRYTNNNWKLKPEWKLPEII